MRGTARHIDSRQRRCPHCRRPMREFGLERVVVDYCDACGGTWFDAGELTRAAGAAVPEGLRQADKAGMKQSRRKCPDCGRALIERPIDLQSDVRVDQCAECRGLFLDRGEFDRIKQLRRRAGKTALRGHRRPPTGSEAGSGYIDPDSGLAVFFQYLTGLPIEIGQPQTLFPPVTCAIIAVNVVVLIWTLSGGWTGFEEWVYKLGMVPAAVARGERLHSLLTSIFMHGGIFHLVGNMYFLYVAGDNVEERLGWHWYAPFYLACGFVASLAHLAADWGSEIPCVGASGAISGVMGAYVVFFPRNRFLIRWFYFFWYHVRIEIPAWAYLGFWLALQVLFALLGLPGVGWWAHIGGFACGAGIAAAVRILEASRTRSQPWRPARTR